MTQPARVPLPAIDGESLAQLLSELRGSVVLIDYWATWCPPCVEGYPHTVQLSRKYADQPVHIIAVAIDPESQRESVIKVIESANARWESDNRMTNLIAKRGDDLIAAMDDFQIQSGTLPTLKLYAPDGTVTHVFGDGAPEPIDFGQVDVAIRKTLLDSSQE